MKWEIPDIFKAIGSWGIFTFISVIIAKRMDWRRFRKTDVAKEGKVDAETASQRISAEVKISDAALQWTVNLASRYEKVQAENDRLHDIIDLMKGDFEPQVQDFNRRILQLEKEFEKSNQILINERDKDREEIKRLRSQIADSTK